MRKNTILLISGIVITLLYIIFSASIVEQLYYEREFSNEMYNMNLYFMNAVITSVMVWALAGLYYYVINSVSFSRWYHWLVMAAVAAVAAPITNTAISSSRFTEQGLDYGSQLMSLSIINMAIAFVLFVIVSFSIRWWSSNCRHTPIPE